MKLPSLLWMCAVIVSAGSLLRAEDIYVSQTAAGADDGASAANAKSLAWLNTSGNWGSGANKVSAGDTVHLCGTLTNQLNVLGSGSTDNPITLVFESGAKFSYTYLPICLDINTRDWITIDGGVNGKLENTDNGTALGNHANSIGVQAQRVNHFTVKNLTMTNLYVRTRESMDANNGGQGITVSGSHVLIQNCRISDGAEMISSSFGPIATSNLTIVGNTLLNFNHGITIAHGLEAQPGYLFNVTVLSNRMDGFDVYAVPSGSNDVGFHRNGIFIFNESTLWTTGGGGYCSNVLISCNWIGPGIFPTNPIAGTSAIFIDINTNSQMVGLKIVNNLCTLKRPLYWTAFMGGACRDSFIANNTCVAWAEENGASHGGPIGVSGTNVSVLNNLMYNTGYAASAASEPSGSRNSNDYSGLHFDFNVYWPKSLLFTLANLGDTRDGGPNGGNLSGWRNYWPSLAWDVHSSDSQPLLDANHVPLAADTVARGKGTNLTAWGITTDFNGNPRPATGPWTIGAFEGNAPVVSLVASPTTGTNGQSATLTWTSANATNLVLSEFGEVALNGSTNISLSQVRAVYTATAAGTGGTSSASVTIGISPTGLRVVP